MRILSGIPTLKDVPLKVNYTSQSSALNRTPYVKAPEAIAKKDPKTNNRNLSTHLWTRMRGPVRNHALAGAANLGFYIWLPTSKGHVDYLLTLGSHFQSASGGPGPKRVFTYFTPVRGRVNSSSNSLTPN